MDGGNLKDFVAGKADGTAAQQQVKVLPEAVVEAGKASEPLPPVDLARKVFVDLQDSDFDGDCVEIHVPPLPSLVEHRRGRRVGTLFRAAAQRLRRSEPLY